MHFTLSFIPSLLLAAFAVAHDDSHIGARHHHGSVAKRALSNTNHTLSKRFEGSKWSFYDVGQGACGDFNVENDFIVALNSPQYGGGYPGPQCGKTITMTYNGKTTTATIKDECPGCPFGGLDLSRGLFRYFASEDLGLIYGSWNFNDGSDTPAPAPEPSSVYTPPPEPTSTYVAPPPPSSTYTPPPPPTSSSSVYVAPPSSSVVESSSVWSSSAAPSSSVAPPAPSSESESASANDEGIAIATGSVTYDDTKPYNILKLNGAVVNMAGLVVQAAQLL